MSRDLIEILFLAAIAGFVVFRLYAVLGRRVGSERPQTPPARPAPATAPTAPQSAPRQGSPIGASAPTANDAPGLQAIRAADPTFEPAAFLSGARAAYEMIVQAFAAGDRATLQGLLTPRVFDAYAAALDDREANGGAVLELVRLRHAEIIDAAVEGDTARIAVRFEAELAEGVAGIRETRERWSFERSLRARDPNWLLAGVAQA